METVLIEKIIPDENQPRRYFDAKKLATLKSSIKKLGIKNPLQVEDMGSGRYLLVDGERRFRAAKELSLKKVPVIISKPQKVVDRLVEQFNIQEQHEQWTPVEKANAVLRISEEMGLGLGATLKLLNVTEDVARRYSAYAQLADKDQFTKSEVPMDFVPYIISAKNAAIFQTEHQLEEKFSRQDEKHLERKIIQLILDGDIRKRTDITRIKDSFVKNPKLIQKFIGGKQTSMELYKESKAKGAEKLRQATTNAMWFNSNGTAYLGIRDVPITTAQHNAFIQAEKIAKKLIAIGVTAKED